MRSRTGCQTCRQRKLKCDEIKPECGQCAKANRKCVLSEGIVFRHQQNASMNGADVEDRDLGGKLGGFYAYRNTFDHRSIWVAVPKRVKFYHVTDPYNMASSLEVDLTDMKDAMEDEQPPIVDGPPAPRDVVSSGSSARLAPCAASATHLGRSTANGSRTMSPSSSSTFSNLEFILNSPIRSTPAALSHQGPPMDYGSETTVTLIEEHEVAFLLRHHSEVPGQWMDLNDFSCYFSRQVPVSATTSALLKYATCAYAAKQLGQVRGYRAVHGGSAIYQAEMDRYPAQQHLDWTYIGAKYYDKAISLLMEELSSTGKKSVPATPDSHQNHNQSPYSSLSTLSSSSSTKTSRRNRSDITIAAGAILSVYEFMDHAHTAWARHLSGTKSMFDFATAEDVIPALTQNPGAVTEKRLIPSKARRACFWNFARQDFLAAFISETETRLHTEDLDLWRAAGLHIDDYGLIEASNIPDDGNTHHSVMGEDLIANGIVWLMHKICAFLANRKKFADEAKSTRMSPLAHAHDHNMHDAQWHRLDREFTSWHAGLPDSFKGCARLAPIVDGSIPLDSPRAMFPEIWHSIPACASAMQTYHMGRILLLTHAPQSPYSTATRSIDVASSAEVRHHIAEICGISLARPDQSVRVNAIQQLFTAGRCLTDDRERRVVLDLLRGIEFDLGWATEYRVQQLSRLWGWLAQGV